MTKQYHISNFGSFSGMVSGFANREGYVKYDASKRYAAMSSEQLNSLCEDGRTKAIRAAAATELAERAVSEWRKAN